MLCCGVSFLFRPPPQWGGLDLYGIQAAVIEAFFLVAPPRGAGAMAPRDSGMRWKQFMMCLEEIQFVVGCRAKRLYVHHKQFPPWRKAVLLRNWS